MNFDVSHLVALRLVRIGHIVEYAARLRVVLRKDWRRILRGVLARDQQEFVFQLLAVVAEVVATAVPIIFAARNAQVL